MASLLWLQNTHDLNYKMLRAKHIVLILFIIPLFLMSSVISAQFNIGIGSSYNITWSEFGWDLKARYDFHPNWAVATDVVWFYSDTGQEIRHIRTHWDTELNYIIPLNEKLKAFPLTGIGISRFAAERTEDRNFTFLNVGAGIALDINPQFTVSAIQKLQWSSDTILLTSLSIMFKL